MWFMRLVYGVLLDRACFPLQTQGQNSFLQNLCLDVFHIWHGCLFYSYMQKAGKEKCIITRGGLFSFNLYH